MLELPAPQPWVEPHRRRWVRRRCEPRAAACADREAELVALARAPAPLRRALARVAGRMVATRGWERLGFARLEDYAAESAGVSARELRDWARVDRALGELPVLDAAFRSGAIGWTQLRLVCRVATREDERRWLAFAVGLTARALAREVRAVDRVAREAEAGAAAPVEDEDERRVGVIVRCTPAVRARWWRARQLANRVAGHALSAEAFVEALTGEVASAVPLLEAAEISKPVPCEGLRAARSASSTSSPAVDEVPGARHASAPTFIDAFERDLEAADAFELDARLRRAIRLEARHLAKVAGLLELVASHRLYREPGFSGLDAYAADRLGMAPSQARALVRVARAGRVYPPLRAAFAAGRLSWVQAHALIPLLIEPAAAPARARWVAHAQRVSVRRLRDDVCRAMALGEWAAPALAPAHSGADRADLQTGADIRARGDTVRLFFAAAPDLAQLFRAALACVQRRRERIRGRPCSQSDALDAMLEHALAVWGEYQPLATVAREHRVFARDGWRCTVPGCSSYRNLHGHHIVFRSHGGAGELSNLTTLCAWHHQRGVHAGRVRCTGEAPHALRFELGRRPDRPPLLAYGPGEVLMA